MLYNSDTHSSWNLAGIQNTQDDVIINLVMGSMFLVLPSSGWGDDLGGSEGWRSGEWGTGGRSLGWLRIVGGKAGGMIGR